MYVCPSAPLSLPLTGSGGLPDLQVRTALVDFGQCLIDNDSFRNLRLHNAGNAEVSARIEFPDAALALQGGEPRFFVPAKSFRDVVIVFRPTSSASIDAPMYVMETDDSSDDSNAPSSSSVSSSERFPVRVTARVGHARVSVSPATAFSNFDFGVAYVNEVHTRAFSIVNDGDIAVTYVASLYQRRKPTATATTALVDSDSSGNSDASLASVASPAAAAASATVKSPTPFLTVNARASSSVTASQVTALARTNQRIQEHIVFPAHAPFGLADAEVVASPAYLSIAPVRGTLAPGAPVSFVLTYAPTNTNNNTASTGDHDQQQQQQQQQCDIEYVLVVAHEAASFSGAVRGRSGFSTVDIDVESRLFNFGISRFGGSFARSFAMWNRGNIPVDYVIGPDEDGAGTGNSGGTRGALMPSREAADRWHEAAARLGFFVDVGGSGDERIPAGGRSTVTVRFDPVHEHPVSTAFRVAHARGCETFHLRGQGGMSRIVICDADGRELTGDRAVYDFGVCRKNTATRAVLVLHNVGTLQAEYLLRRRLSPEVRWGQQEHWQERYKFSDSFVFH